MEKWFITEEWNESDQFLHYDTFWSYEFMYKTS